MYPGGIIELAFSYSFKERSSLICNIGTSWDGTTAVPVCNWALRYGHRSAKKFLPFIELYGRLPDTGDSVFSVDGGFSFITGDNFQLNFAMGTIPVDSGNNYYLQIGAAIRIDRGIRMEYNAWKHDTGN